MFFGLSFEKPVDNASLFLFMSLKLFVAVFERLDESKGCFGRIAVFLD